MTTIKESSVLNGWVGEGLAANVPFFRMLVKMSQPVCQLLFSRLNPGNPEWIKGRMTRRISRPAGNHQDSEVPIGHPFIGPFQQEADIFGVYPQGKGNGRGGISRDRLLYGLDR